MNYQIQEKQLLIGFKVNFVSTVRRVTNNNFEVINSFLVLFESCEYQTFIIDIVEYIHGRCTFLETRDWMFHNMKSMLVTLSFDTQLGKFFMERSTHLLIVISQSANCIAQSFYAKNGFWFRQKILCVGARQIKEFTVLRLNLLRHEIVKEVSQVLVHLSKRSLFA